jgi:hypothetical protein
MQTTIRAIALQQIIPQTKASFVSRQESACKGMFTKPGSIIQKGFQHIAKIILAIASNLLDSLLNQRFKLY